MKGGNVLLSLMNVITAAEGRSWLKDIPVESRRILTFIATELHAEREICIGDILGHGDFGAPVTASRRLRDLEAAGWITITQDPGNHRRRLLGLTPKAKLSFDYLAYEVAQDLRRAQEALAAKPVSN